MKRRDFLTILLASLPSVALAQMKKRRYFTVVKEIRSQNPDGSFSVAWSAVNHPKGKKWTEREAKKYGYKLIWREQ